MKRSFAPQLLVQVISLFTVTIAYSQAPKVPSQMRFADVELTITEGARKIIQEDADNLMKHPKYFEVKLARVDLYMPIIERILKEEGLPEDFKYLAIQESALVSDAVSTSNAVGFWQFKRDSGLEVGMRIDDVVDERMNIVSSTRGAARYLKRHNFYFDNWVFTLLSYYLGRGGASNVVDKNLYGAKKLIIDEKTNWYILRNLAHKVVFEDQIGKNSAPEYRLVEYQDGARKNFKHIAKELEIEEELIREYNKWLKSGSIPEDRLYTVVVPVLTDEYRKLLAKNLVAPSQEPIVKQNKKGGDTEIKFLRDEAHLIEVNNIQAFVAREGDDITILTLKAGISKKKFYKYNEIPDNAILETGQIYYLKSKKNKAKLYFHTVKEGESLWSISQKYGIKMKAILRKNRMDDESELKPGRILWLHKTRPAKLEPEYLIPETEEKEKDQILPNAAYEEVITKQEDRPDEVSETTVFKETLMQQSLTKSNEKTEGGSSGLNTQNTFSEEKRYEPEAESYEHEFLIEVEVEDEISEEDQEELVLQEEEVPEVVTAEQQQESKKKEFAGDVEVKFVNISESAVNDKKETHVVQKGETLYSISRMYKLSVADLLAINNMKIEDGLKAGQELMIVQKGFPKEKESATVKVVEQKKSDEGQKGEFLYHTVTSGETLYKIARDYQVTIKEVMDWNNKEDFNVGIGEILKIKKQ